MALVENRYGIEFHFLSFQNSRCCFPSVAIKKFPLMCSYMKWEIDGISSDAMQSFMFGFYRDPNYAILGSGNLRINIEMAFSNGTRFVQVDYASDSVIEECEWGTRGTWKSDSFSYVFEVTRDMSKMKVALNSKLLKGIVHLNSITKPRFPDGKIWPSEYSSSEALPYFHFVEHIPVGNTDVDLVVEGEKWVWAGIGGSVRLWGAFSWFTCLQGMHIVRATAGPYALTLWDFKSNIKRGKQYSSVILFEDGKKIFGTQNMEESELKDYFTWQKIYEGKGATGTLKDQPTGFELELISLQRKKHITFSVEHKNVAFEYILGGGHGASGFTSDVTAGQVGLEWFRGVALTETLNFPPKSPLFKVQYFE
jgi:hypothetical protein